jgi:hypothetical protein
MAKGIKETEQRAMEVAIIRINIIDAPFSYNNHVVMQVVNLYCHHQKSKPG